MRRLAASFLAFATFTASLFAAPPVLTLTPASPKEGDIVMVTAAVPAVFDIRGAVEQTKHGTRAAMFTMPKGSVVIVATAGAVAKPSDVAVVAVGSGQPVPTPPGPQPSPEAVVLAKTLTEAIAGDPVGEKVLLPKLAAVFKADAPGIADDVAVKTIANLFDAMAVKFKAAGTPGKLLKTQRAIAEYLSTKLPSDGDFVLTDNTRATARYAFAIVAEALALLK